MSWAEEVKKRDGGKCFLCGGKTNIVAHHMYSKDKYPELKDEIDNGITLCGKHHKEFHQTFGYGNNTGFQFLRWLKQQNKEENSGVGYADFFKIFERIDDLSEKTAKNEVVEVNQNNEINTQDLVTTGSLKTLLESLQEGFINVETSIPKSLYDRFDRKCKALNLTIAHALHLLIHNEVKDLLDSESNLLP